MDEETKERARVNSRLKYDVKFKIKHESDLFNVHVKNIISEHFGKITQIEGREDLKDLDFSGVDCWSSIDGDYRSISLRASHQLMPNKNPWDTFTFRELELKKRIKALDFDLEIHIPSYHIEYSFIDELLSIRYVSMRRIIGIANAFVNNNLQALGRGICWKSWHNGERTLKFLVMECNWLIDNGIPVRRWNKGIGWDGPPLYQK